MSNGDSVDAAERVVYFTQLRNVANGRIVEREFAAVAQLQDCDGCHSFGDRGPVVCSCVVDSLMCVPSSFSKREGLCLSLATHQRKSCAHNPVLLKHRFKLRTEFFD